MRSGVGRVTFQKLVSRYPFLFLGALLGAALLPACQSRESRFEDSDFIAWGHYGGDPAGTKFSALDQIDRDNVAQLEVAWVYRADDMRQRTTIECNPIVVDGVAYLTSPGLRLHALEAATGKPVWSFDPFEGERGSGVNRGVTYWSDGSDRRIFYVAGNFLYALDAASGLKKEEFGDRGRVDLREGLDRDFSGLSVTATTPGVVFEDLFIVGSAVGEGPTPAAPGHIRAFDVRTGERRWIFHTIPHPGEFGYETWPSDAWKTAGGANSWGGLTLDEERGWVFAGTGSPAYDHYGGNRKGQNLFGNSVLALDARSGRRIWHFQVVHHDLWDYDIPCPPNLVTVEREGTSIDAVAQATKMGLLFLFERETGKPLFPIVEREVPPSDLPGEEAWPTQPFPSKPPPYAQISPAEAEVTDLTAADRALALERYGELRKGNLYVPPGLQGSLVLPQFNGGTDWGGAAFDPESGLLYVNASNEAEWISMVPAQPAHRMTLGRLGRRLFQASCATCHGEAGASKNGELPGASLESMGQTGTAEAITKTLKGGKGQMPAFPSLTDIETRALVAFLLGQNLEEEVAVDEAGEGIGDEIPYVATGHNELRSQEGFPLNPRPWGVLNAIDLSRGEIRWQVPLGTYPELEKRGFPPTGTFNMGGPLVTAGGLVFIGAAMDERFRAFDKDTGELLWEFQLDAGAYATPATFEIEGKQYVLIAAGGGGKPGTRSGNGYYCFALP